MSECATSNEHHAGNGVCEPEQTWACSALQIEGGGKLSVTKQVGNPKPASTSDSNPNPSPNPSLTLTLTLTLTHGN
jgi:hypothetical protein